MKTFQPICTLPPPGPTFVAGPNIRSTLDIVWSCLSVILLSTWSILHLNVPPLVHPRNRRQRLMKMLWLAWRKVKWMLWALLAPELILAYAIDKFVSARRSVREMKTQAEAEGREWTMSHAFFSDMGGFLIKFDDAASGDAQPAGLEDVIEFKETQAHRFRHIGEAVWKPHLIHCQTATEIKHRLGDDGDRLANLLRLCGSIWALNAFQLAVAHRLGIISELPGLSEEELNDRSKSDGLVKLLALAQLGWLVLQLIVRAVQGKPSSQLEVMALSYAVCAIISYACVWFQPKDVSQPIILQANRCPSQEELLQLVQADEGWPSMHARHYTRSDDYMHDNDVWHNALLLGTSLFGFIHLAAWNFDFPTLVEKLLWRVFSLILSGIPVLLMALTVVPWTLGLKGLEGDSDIGFFVVILALLFWIVSRLVLFVETFRSLYYIEPAGYTTTWAVDVLHIG